MFNSQSIRPQSRHMGVWDDKAWFLAREYLHSVLCCGGRARAYLGRNIHLWNLSDCQQISEHYRLELAIYGFPFFLEDPLLCLCLCCAGSNLGVIQIVGDLEWSTFWSK